MTTAHAPAGLAAFAPKLTDENVRLPAAPAAANACLFVGFVGLAATVAGGFMLGGKYALGAYLVGFLTVMGFVLGQLALLLIVHSVNAGWTATIRRQVENIASMVPVGAALFVPIAGVALFTDFSVWHWMDVEPGVDVLLDKKRAFLNTPFWLGRAALYFVVWGVLATSLARWSKQQDSSGDVSLTRRSRQRSGWGLLAFGLTCAFAGFDWVMTLDHHWFSTMLGVWFFAGSFLSGVGLLVIVLSGLKKSGRLEGVVTEEHFHDLGKLLFSFTVFWAYISFSQYFLIWYANIPEETAFFLKRTASEGGYRPVFLLLAIGHFIVPFVLLLFRQVKRTPALIEKLALWQILMHICDLYFFVAPMVEPDAKHDWTKVWVFVIGVVGPVGLFLGLLIRRMASGPLIPLKDPRLLEGLEHKNYV